MRPFLPAVVDGELQRVSASQIELFNAQDNPDSGCQRKWWWNKVLRKPIPSGKPAEAGSASHKNIEDFLKGKPIVFNPIEAELLRFMPKPLDPHNRPEVEFEMPVQDCTLIGKIDVLNDSGKWIDNEGVSRPSFANEVEILDWKFTGNVQARAETPKSLATDLAMNVYGKHAAENDVEWIRLSHAYSQTKNGKKALKVSTLVHRDQVEEYFSLKVLPLIGEMRKAARITDFHDIPANRGACYAFGQRCPFYDECQTGPVEMFGDFLHVQGDSTVSLLSAMLPKSLPVSEPAPSSPPLDTSLVSLAPASPPVETVGILPPDAPPADPVLATVGTEGQFHTDASGQLYRFKKGQWSFAGAKDKQEQDYEAARDQQFEEGGTVIPIKRGRGRPPKIKSEAVPSNDGSANKVETSRPELSAVETVSAPSTPEAKEAANSRNVNGTVAAARLGPTTPPASGVELFIRAVTNLPSKPIEVYAQAIAEKLASTCGQAGVDIRCSKHPSLTYGSWKGALATAIRQYPPDKGIYTLLSRGEFYDVVGDTISEFADHVVRGVA
jgi:hypothetical protein